MAVPFWHKVLYIINIVVFGLGAACASLSISKLRAKDGGEVLIKPWMLKVGAGFGFTVALIALIGIWGVSVNKSRKKAKSCNLCLWVYFVIVFLGIIIEGIIVAATLILKGRVKDLKGNVTKNTKVVVRELHDQAVDYLRNHYHVWRDIQNQFDCCGWNTTDITAIYGDLATGDDCLTVGIKTCKDELIDQAEGSIKIIALFSGLLCFVELLALIGSCWLLCCFTYKSEEQLKTQGIGLGNHRPTQSIQYT